MPKVTGTFNVTLKTLSAYDASESAVISRRSIDKVFSGPLSGTSLGEMLAVMGTQKGSAGYVAMERFTGELSGKKGSFALQHSSTMTRGVPTQNVSVVPDSGTGELTGLKGQMTILVESGAHSYVFDYELDVSDGG